eukprot:303054-Alexandrium_andersonii.AAC.1
MAQPPERAAPSAPALADLPQPRLEAPAEQQASASSAAAPPAATVMQGLAQEFLNEVNPAGGPGLPLMQRAVSGATWLQPDPRTALAREGHMALAPQ